MKYEVTVKIEGRKDWTTIVEAPREGLAQTRAIANYMNVDEHAPLFGEFVDYDVTLKG